MLKPYLSSVTVFEEVNKVRASLVAQLVKNPLGFLGTIPGLGPLEKGKATHSYGEKY